MAEKYIIYTMGNKNINDQITKILFIKGYTWSPGTFNAEIPPTWIKTNYIAIDGSYIYWDILESNKSFYKELTFRELCELPDVNDEYEELAKEILLAIDQYCLKTNCAKKYKTPLDWAKQQDWCKVWEKIKLSLGLE